MAKVSVIVPAHNAEKHIQECLESLLKQTLKEIEIICVNDGSIDSTQSILEDYCHKDGRVLGIQKEKCEGAAEARRTGVEHATSEYICFLDSDDYFDESFCEVMVSFMENHQLDLAECAYCSFSESYHAEHFSLKDTVLMNQSQFLDAIVANTIVNGKEAVVLWNKIYRRSIIEQYVKYYGENLLEDYLFNLQYYCGVRNYAYIHQILYHYRITPNSLSQRYNPKMFTALVEVQKIKEDSLKRIGLFDEKNISDAAVWFCKYVIKYLMANQMVFREKEFTQRIISDNEFKRQAGKIRKWYSQVLMHEFSVKLMLYAGTIYFLIRKKAIRVVRLCCRRKKR